MGAVSGFYLAYQHWCITPVRLNVSIQSMRELFMEAWSIGLSNMVWAFHQYSPVMLTIAIAGAEATGLFGAAHRLVVSLPTFSYVYHFSLFPEMARRAGRSPEALGTLLRASFRLVAWLGCGFALLLSIGARPMMSGLYGESFAGAATALAVLAWILPITILGGHARWSLITLGFQRCVLVSQLAGSRRCSRPVPC